MKVSFNSADIRDLATAFSAGKDTLETEIGSFAAAALPLEHESVTGESAQHYTELYDDLTPVLASLTQALGKMATELRTAAERYDQTETASTVHQE